MAGEGDAMQGRSGPFWYAAWLGIDVVVAVLAHRYLKRSCSSSCVRSIDDSSHHHFAASVSRRWRILGFLGVAQLMLILDVTVVAVALPNIAADLGLGRQPLTWVVSGYTLAFGGLLLLGGRAADLFGARRLVVVGLVAFAGASLLAGLAPTGWALLAGRVLQGLAAAFLSPSARIAATSLAGTSPAGFSRAFTTTAVVAAVAALVTIAVAPCRQAPGSPAGVQRDERAAPAGRRRRRPGPGPDLARSSRSIEKGAS